MPLKVIQNTREYAGSLAIYGSGVFKAALGFGQAQAAIFYETPVRFVELARSPLIYPFEADYLYFLSVALMLPF